MSKNLVIYYSRKGENYVNGGIKKIEKGNTEVVAEYIRDAVGADLFEVDTVVPYSEDYMTCINEAKEEMQKGKRPELKELLTDISNYDNIVIAGPCWWGTYPMAIFTQLEALDFTGKNVFALMTHEGSGQAGSERDVKKYCKGARVGKSLAVQGGKVSSERTTVEKWAKENLK
ncbi:MAG: flavodoxin [Eubacteriales bacterium]|nr:flavodoxin [Eubacteriales bacterium]